MKKEYKVLYWTCENAADGGEVGDKMASLYVDDTEIATVNVDHLVWEDFDKRGCFRDPQH